MPRSVLSRSVSRNRPVTPVSYAPPIGYELDIELYRAGELRRRIGDAARRGFERIDFNSLLYVTAGRYWHLVDFDLLDCSRGSVIVLRPGQVHRFGDAAGWNGWMLVFRSELLPPKPRGETDVRALEATRPLDDLPSHLKLSSASQQAVGETLERMTVDAQRPASYAVNALLRSQLEALLWRLGIDDSPSNQERGVDLKQRHRFRCFAEAVNREFANWRTVSDYAAHLGCSERSLTRAALAVEGRSAKAVLTARIVLEAKRLLAHSLMPVANVGYELGFDEPTNFVKFFRREAKLTPGDFRARMHAFTGRNYQT